MIIILGQYFFSNIFYRLLGFQNIAIAHKKITNDFGPESGIPLKKNG
jgi:hypothetical protein